MIDIFKFNIDMPNFICSIISKKQIHHLKKYILIFNSSPNDAAFTLFKIKRK